MVVYQVVGEKYGFVRECKTLVETYNVAEKSCIKFKQNISIYLLEIEGNDINSILFDEYNYVDYCDFLVRTGRGSRIDFLERL